MTGIEMIRRIKKRNKSIDIMVISGYSNTDYFTESIELGIDDYILKPITKKSFEKSLLKVLEKVYFKQELENHKNMLEQKVDDQIKMLQEKEEALMQQSKLAAMGEIMDIVAHQWKQPLHIITLKTNFLEEFPEDDKIDIKDVKECNKGVREQVNHLIYTLNEFRSFLRPNTNMQVCNLLNIFESISILLKDDLIENKIKLDIICSKDIELKINQNELKHIFISLISNSKDAFNITQLSDVFQVKK